jgi:prefoldin subunit 5
LALYNSKILATQLNKRLQIFNDEYKEFRNSLDELEIAHKNCRSLES